jgi:hypothetical protein
VVGGAAGGLLDLGPAAEAVGDHQRVGVGLAHGGQQGVLADLHGDLVMLALEAERARHAAAAGVQHLGVQPGGGQQPPVGAHAHDGLLVAVALHDRPAGQRRRRPPVGLAGQQLGQGVGLLLQAPGALVVGEQVGQLVPEGGQAARLQPDQRHAFGDPRAERGQDLAELAPGQGEHAEVVQRATAAQRRAG